MSPGCCARELIFAVLAFIALFFIDKPIFDNLKFTTKRKYAMIFLSQIKEKRSDHDLGNGNRQ